MRRSALALALFLSASTLSAQDAGVLPVGKDGKPLNLDFETGTLKDWTAEGKAFDGQPIKGDTVAPRRADSKSHHQGKRGTIPGYESKYNDERCQGRSEPGGAFGCSI